MERPRGGRSDSHVAHDQIIPAPTYILARAAWVPTRGIWHADGRFTRLEGDPRGDYAAALRAGRPRPTSRDPDGPA